MSLNEDARHTINELFEMIKNDKNQRITKKEIGVLSDIQLKQINSIRKFSGKPEVYGNKIYFIGKHMHESRIEKDGYKKEDVFKMIKRSLSDESFPAIDHRTISQVGDLSKINLVSPEIIENNERKIQSVAVLVHSSSCRDGLEIYNVIPYGDGKR